MLRAVVALAAAGKSEDVGGRLGPASPCKPNTDHPQCNELLALNAELAVRFQTPFLGPRHCIKEWEAIGADPIVLQIIAQGVKLPIHKLPQRNVVPVASSELRETLEEYCQMGVLRPLAPVERANTRV